MTMSKDRVRFTLGYNYVGHTSVRRAFERAFGVSLPSIPHQGLTVICRPSQFARFMIYRNDEGGRNGFKELNATLIPAHETEIIDVSRNAAGE